MKPTWERKYPTKEEVRGAVMMMVQPVEIDCKYVYPIEGVEIEHQPEHVLFCLCVWGEARNQCIQCQEAVAQVILNRFYAQKSYFGKSIREVILKHSPDGLYQFSCMNPTNKNYKKMAHPDALSWYKVVRIVLPLYATIKPAFEKGRILFYHTNDVQPEFFDKLTFVIQIGDHLFYSD